MINSPQTDFSTEQLQAINHFNGPALILAGPGSGKTTVIVNRILNLILNKHINPSNILVITFSKAAALQMKERFDKLSFDKSYPVNFGTFHSIFLHIIKDSGLYPELSVVNDKERKKFFSIIIKDIWNIDNPDISLINSLSNSVSLYKNSDYKRFEAGDISISFDEFLKIYNSYQKLMKINNKIDFDDMMIFCYKLLTARSDIKKQCINKFKYILIDEFQDINDIQYEIIKLLAGESQNVFSVGDDDQSIYAFRGSRPELMQKFLNDFKKCKRINLLNNYRCGKNIIRHADKLIKNNKDRLKRPRQISKSNNKGSVVCNILDGEEKQALYIISTLKELIQIKDYTYNDIAILYRTEHCSEKLESLLKKENIPIHKIRENNHNNTNAIHLLTAHAAKGLEFRVVFVISLCEGIFPHIKAINDKNIEEERRLMYVAMTRAKEKLFLCSYITKRHKKISVFLFDSKVIDRIRIMLYSLMNRF